MKNFFAVVALGFLLTLPLNGNSSLLLDGGGKGGAINLTNPSSVPAHVLHRILTEAAPYFNLRGDQMIRAHYACKCITVEPVGPNKYRVVYGGIGIQILVDSLGDDRHYGISRD